MMRRVAKKWKRPPKLSTVEWLGKYFYLPAEGADLYGPYNLDYVPYLWGIFHALDNPADRVVVLMKAAQVGWTFGLIGFLGKRIHIEPSAMIVLFPKDGAAREFGDEKLKPTVQATPVLAERIDVSGSRKTGQRANFKRFVGGFLKLVGSNSISNVKSTPAPLAVVEEPDDTNENIAEQGDAIRLIRERLKRFRGGKLVLGGTPGVKGISRVEEFTDISDKRVLPVRCHECGESHVLDWENVSYLEREDGPEHPVYGKYLPDTAVYVCPHCGSAWSDWQRQQNVLNTCIAARDAGDPYCGWEPTVTGAEARGFIDLSELYVCIPGTSLASVVRDFLEAEHDAAKGDESGRIVFTNSKLGKPYEYKDDNASDEQLREVAKDYPELIVPHGGLLLSIGVDVQHNRLAIIVRAWGRGDESWLVYWGEIFTDSTVADKNDAVWDELDKLVLGQFKHANGRSLYAAAITIDGSDGQTNDAVYHWARTRSKKHKHIRIMVGKGSSAQQDPEIFSTPRAKSIDHHRPDRQTKADRHGIKIYIIGTNKAKDWLAGQMKLEAAGRGRWHFYKNVRSDYFEQITSEVKAPHRSVRNRRVWQLKSGRRNEALDCEAYALHAARAIRVHLMRPAQWDELEQRLTQADLFQDVDEPAGEQTVTAKSTDQSYGKSAKKPLSRAELARKMNGG